MLFYTPPTCLSSHIHDDLNSAALHAQSFCGDDDGIVLLSRWMLINIDSLHDRWEDW